MRRKRARRPGSRLSLHSSTTPPSPRATPCFFWADYLHMAIYLRELAKLVAGDPKSVLLLAGADDATIGRAISFRTTLLSTRRGTKPTRPMRCRYGDSSRAPSACWCVTRSPPPASHACATTMRAATSAWTARCCSPATTCAQSRGTPDRYAGRARLGPGVLRARARGARRVLDVPSALAAGLGRHVRWLPWGDSGAFPVLGARPDGIAGGDVPSAHELLNEVAHASLVVADAYHFRGDRLERGRAGGVRLHRSHGERARRQQRRGVQLARQARTFFSQYDAADF